MLTEEIRQFAIDSHAGLITTTSPMDREIRSSYNLIILAYVEAYPELVASFQVNWHIFAIKFYAFFNFHYIYNF